MRIAALIFGLLGVAGSGVLGAKWTNDINSRKADIELTRKLIEISGDATAKAKMAELDRLKNAAYALLAGAALGLAGCGLVFTRKGVIAGAVFLVAFIAPLVIAQDGKAAIFTFGLALAGLFAFFVKPAPPAKRRREPGIPADADMVG